MNLLRHITAKLASFSGTWAEEDAIPSTLDKDTRRLQIEDSFAPRLLFTQKNHGGEPLQGLDGPSQRTISAARHDKQDSNFTPRQTLHRPVGRPSADCKEHIGTGTVFPGASEEKREAVANLLSSARFKMDATDWQGCLLDCELILSQEPTNQMALMWRAISTVKKPVTGDIYKQAHVITAGKLAGARSPQKRYPTLVTSGLNERYDDAAVARIEPLVRADASDRCAVALLLTIHFKRWFWGDDSKSHEQAVAIARTMQQQWPNDRVAMSALFYLVGSLEKGNRAAIDFASRNVIPGDDIYYRSDIQPRVIFDYPMHIQRPYPQEHE